MSYPSCLNVVVLVRIFPGIEKVYVTHIGKRGWQWIIINHIRYNGSIYIFYLCNGPDDPCLLYILMVVTGGYAGQRSKNCHRNNEFNNGETPGSVAFLASGMKAAYAPYQTADGGKGLEYEVMKNQS